MDSVTTASDTSRNVRNAQTRRRRKMLRESEVISYWQERAEKLGETAVGYGDQSLDKQEDFYRERKQFIFTYVDRSLATLDYGCGIGRYANEFTEEYFGVDVTGKMIQMACKLHPDKEFEQLDEPIMNTDIEEGIELSWMEQFFTATVLQHCDDDLVIRILKSVFDLKPTGFRFCLYENSMNFKKPHIVGRKPMEYNELIRQAGFKVVTHDWHSHLVKKEEHSLYIAEV